MNRASTLLLSFLFAVHAEAAEVGGEAAWDTAKAAITSELRDPSYPQARVAMTRFPRIEEERIDEVRRQNAAPAAKVLRVGVEREIAEALSANVRQHDWVAAPNGGLSTRLAVTSPGAVALRSALDVTELPEGAELRFVGSDAPDAPIAVTGAEIAALRASQPRYWTPVTDGETQTIEVYLPAGADPSWARVRLEAVSHLFVAPTGSLAGAKIGESDDCEFDAKCVEDPPQIFINAKNSTARMLFQTDGSSALCTGTLLNDSDDSTQVPNFFSASHCIDSQSVASTLTTFWFYEATSCGSGVLDGGVRQVAGGATIQFANASSDVLLLRLNNAPPSGAYFLGWNSATLADDTEILVLHHPAGDVKKVSLGAVKGFGGSTIASGQFIKVGYTDGTTEGGSSGCGLLAIGNGEFQLRGGLLGGSASCANSGSLSTVANSDDFSRFDQAFPNLRPFLQPSVTPPSVDYSGAWSNPAQSGWGLAILKGTSGAYAVNLYHYDQDNTSAWYLSAGTLSGTRYSQPVLGLAGPWFGTSPFNPGAVSTRVAGTVSLSFTSDTTANLSFTIDGRTVNTTVRKLSF